MMPGGGVNPDGRHRLAWTILAVALFAAAFAVLHREALRAGPSGAISIEQRSLDHLARGVILSDQIWVAWAAGRNAWHLAHAPNLLFDFEHCFPTPRAMALGEPVLTLGVLGVPASIAGANPIATYNFALFALWMVGALAMFALVRDWTAVPAAGIVAGLIVVGEPTRVANVVHPYVNDTAWTVLALLFAQRLLARGRWSDAVALGISASLQIGSGLYPLLGGMIAALPVGIALLWRYGLRRARAAQLLLAASCVAATAWLVFSPYLALRGANPSMRRADQYFTPFADYLPDGLQFPGWLPIALALAAVLFGVRRRRDAEVFDARPALLAGGVLAMLVASGPHLVPWIGLDLYALLSALLPGLDAIRVPGLVACGTHLALAALAGFGAAALLSFAPALQAVDRGRPARTGSVRTRPLLLMPQAIQAMLRTARSPQAPGAALALAVWLALFGPPAVATRISGPYRARWIKPADDDLRFYHTLAVSGGGGAILELPTTLDPITDAVDQIFLSGFHRRRTSACRSSFYPAEFGRVRQITQRLPDPRALTELRRLGFTTIVFHRRGVRPSLLSALRHSAATRPGCLRFLTETENRVAFEIGAADACSLAPPPRALGPPPA